MKIKKAQEKDLEKIAKVFKQEFRKPPYDEYWTEETALKRIKEYFNKSTIFFVEEEKDIIGFIIFNIYTWFDGKKANIQEFAISADHQGKGIGKSLYQYLESYLKKQDVKSIELMSEKKSKAFNIYNLWGYKLDKDFVYLSKKLN